MLYFKVLSSGDHERAIGLQAELKKHTCLDSTMPIHANQRVEVNKLIALIPPSVLLFYDAKALSEWETGEVSFLLIN